MKLEIHEKQKSLQSQVMWDYPDNLLDDSLSLLPTLKQNEPILTLQDFLANTHTLNKTSQHLSHKLNTKSLDSLIKYCINHKDLALGYLAFLQTELHPLPIFSQGITYPPFLEMVLNFEDQPRKKKPSKSNLYEIEKIHTWVRNSQIEVPDQIRGVHCWDIEQSLIRSYRLSILKHIPLYISLSGISECSLSLDPCPWELSKVFLLQVISQAFQKAQYIWIAGDCERRFVERCNVSPRKIRQAPRVIRYKEIKLVSPGEKRQTSSPENTWAQNEKTTLVIMDPIDSSIDLYTLIYNIAELQANKHLERCIFTSKINNHSYWNQGLMIAESLRAHDCISLEQDIHESDLDSRALVIYPSLEGVRVPEALTSILKGHLVLVPNILKNRSLIEEFEILTYEPGHRRDLAHKIQNILSEPQKKVEKIQLNLSKFERDSNQQLLEEYLGHYSL